MPKTLFLLAEREGFEPPVPFDITGFQDQLHKPLGHLSIFKLYNYSKGFSHCQAGRFSKKWLKPFLRVFSDFASRVRSRAAKPAKYENLWVFIRSDAHVVRAGLNIRGCGPLSTLGFFDRLSRRFRWPLLPEILLVEFHQLHPRLLEYFQRELVGVALAVYHP